MTEQEENLLRNLLAKMRESNRSEFGEIMLDVFFARERRDDLCILEHANAQGRMEAAVVVVRGEENAKDLVAIALSYFDSNHPASSPDPIIDEDEDEDEPNPWDHKDDP